MCQVLVLVNPLILPILMPASIKQVALQTIDLEARAVSGLAAYINDDFEKTVRVIAGGRGRVVEWDWQECCDCTKDRGHI